MAPFKENKRNFITAAVVIVTASSLAQIFLLGTSYAALLVSPGISVSVLIGCWWAFDNFLWKHPYARTLGLSKIPDISGNWKGQVDRLGEGNPHDFQMTVEQTYSNIDIITKTSNSDGNSIKTFFLCDDKIENFVLINYWTCTTKGANNAGIEHFTGLSRLKIVTEGASIVLEDSYFTNRNTPTQGHAELRRV